MKYPGIITSFAVTAGLLTGCGSGADKTPHSIKAPTPKVFTVPETPSLAHGIAVEWDGTVEAVSPDPKREYYIIRRRVGQISAKSMVEFKKWEQDQYPEEELKGGHVTFYEDRENSLCEATVYGADTRDKYTGELQDGGWSYLGNPPNAELCLSIVAQLREFTHLEYSPAPRV